MEGKDNTLKMRNNNDGVLKSTSAAQIFKSMTERTITYLRKFRVSRNEAKNKNS